MDSSKSAPKMLGQMMLGTHKGRTAPPLYREPQGLPCHTAALTLPPVPFAGLALGEWFKYHGPIFLPTVLLEMDLIKLLRVVLDSLCILDRPSTCDPPAPAS